MQDLFKETILMLNMDGTECARESSAFCTHGGAVSGIRLDGLELEEFMAGGGDGMVARLNGGWISVRQGLDLTGSRRMTLCVRLCDRGGAWNAPLLARDDPQSALGVFLYGDGASLRYKWMTSPLSERVATGFDVESAASAKSGQLVVGAPVSMIGAEGWHDIVVRFNDARLELFVDGVLVDEEWPHGGLADFRTPLLIGAGYVDGELRSGFDGDIDHIAVWDRALSDEEIRLISGGPERVAVREAQILGPEQASMQYWSPRGYNTNCGDCMPFYHDGVLHIFYLFDRRHHGSKWGLGAHQYGHVSTRDLKHWEHHPLAVPIERQWECAMGTGDIIWCDGVYNIFYTDCGARCEFSDKPESGSRIYRSRSTDGVHFTKDFKPLMLGGDCQITRNAATGEFQLIREGTSLMVSTDMETWREETDRFVEVKEGTTAECPNIFEWNGWFYLIMGRNAIWKSRTPKGPWDELAPTVYDGLFVPKVGRFGDRRILAGFLGSDGWGGSMVLRELVQHGDGSLGMKWLEAQLPHVTDACVEGRAAQVSAPDGVGFCAIDAVPQDALITLRVSPEPGVGMYGICVRGNADYDGGCELRFDPERGEVQWGSPAGGDLAPDANGSVDLGGDYRVCGFKGLVDRPFDLRLIVKGDIVDAEIGGERTMISRRRPIPEGDSIVFSAVGGQVRFEDIRIYALGEPVGSEDMARN